MGYRSLEMGVRPTISARQGYLREIADGQRARALGTPLRRTFRSGSTTTPRVPERLLRSRADRGPPDRLARVAVLSPPDLLRVD